MNINNPNAMLRQNEYTNPAPKLVTQFSSKHMPLNSPMVDRVHKAKSGCSACGKKVA